MRGTRFVIKSLVIFACGCGISERREGSTSENTAALTLAQHEAICQADARVIAGLVPLDICVGGDIFFRETFDGNGRTCASCHPVDNNFALDPAFIARLSPFDPLFVAEFDPQLTDLERPAEMHNRSLILENVDGTQQGGPNVQFVLRAVPHTFSMGVTITSPGQPNPPQDRTGWSGDGAPGQGRLSDFTNGAINQHFTRTLNRDPNTDFRVASDDEGDRVADFMRATGRTNDINLNALRFTDIQAEAGRVLFSSVGCNRCHENAGAGTTNLNFDTGVESSRNSGLAGFPIDGGFDVQPQNPDGSFGDRTFNTPSLIEAADTGPFFHTDTTISGSPNQDTPTANTIEQAVAFYSTPAFANSQFGGGSPLPMSSSDIINIARFLRATNAVFNIQIAIARADAAQTLRNHGLDPALQQRLLLLAREEVDDAITVLQGAQGEVWNPSQMTLLQNARTDLTNAANGSGGALVSALNELTQATSGISSAMRFTIGTGTLMD